MTSTPDTNSVEDKAFHPESLIAKNIEKDVVKAIRILLNHNMTAAGFLAYGIEGRFKVTIERIIE